MKRAYLPGLRLDRPGARPAGRPRLPRGGRAIELVDGVVEVYREPARPGPARQHWSCAAIETLGADATIAPVAAPRAGIRLAHLLPVGSAASVTLIRGRAWGIIGATEGRRGAARCSGRGGHRREQWNR